MKIVPAGYYEYTVFPLEGEWDLLDRSKPATDKSNFKYTIMIRQPDFLTEEYFERFLEQSKRKKPNPFLEKIRFEQVEDGLSCQMMHLGSFDDEPESFARMEACVKRTINLERHISQPKRRFFQNYIGGI